MKTALPLLALLLLCVVIPACAGVPSPAAEVSAPANRIATATAGPPSATPLPPTATPMPATATPEPPPVETLSAQLMAEIYPAARPGPDSFGIEAIEVIPLTTASGSLPLWAAFTTGPRSFDPEQTHFVAIYTSRDGSWQAVSRLELPEPDYLFEDSVNQVNLAPDQIWLEVQGGAGAHSSIYSLLRFDGQNLHQALANFNSSPGAGNAVDLNGDDLPEVILNRTEPYVFCYACSVRLPAYELWRWDGQALGQVTLNSLPATAPDNVRELNNRAVELAQGWLWKEARETIAQAAALEPANPTVTWNRILIDLHAEDLAEQAETGPYPLLGHIFYGDYGAALDLMRPYSPEVLFGPESPLVAGTVAEGWETALRDWVGQATGLALAVRPDLAAAYFLRGWATALVEPDNPQVLADLAEAVQLEPAESLFVDSLTYYLSQSAGHAFVGQRLAAVEADLLAEGYTVESRPLTYNDAGYLASIYTHPEWYMHPNHLMISKISDGQAEIIYVRQDETNKMLFSAYTTEGKTTLDWLDMNGDGLMELPFTLSSGGNCWACTRLQVLQLRPDDNLLNLTEAVPAEDALEGVFVVYDLADVDGDGVLEWKVLDTRWEFAFGLCHACSPAATRLYAWNGRIYRNASAQFSAFYQEQIDDLTVQVEEILQSQEPWTGFELGPMISLLLAYENAGRLAEGWAVFEQYSDPALYKDRADEEQLRSLEEARAFFRSSIERFGKITLAEE